MGQVRPATQVSFAALASVPFVMVLSNSMIVPILPDIQKALHISALQTGLLITAFSLAAGLVIPIGGYLSDRFGRKTVIVPCLVLFGLGGGLAGLAPALARHPYGLMIAGRVVQGIGAGGTYQVAMALVGDIFHSPERSKALGLLEAANGIGKVVSPIIGAAVAIVAWFAPFYVYPLVAWAAAVVVWRLVGEPDEVRSRRHPFGRYLRSLGQVWTRKGLPLAASFLAGALVLFFLFGVLSYYADILESPYHVLGLRKGLVIAIPVAVMAVTSYLCGAHLSRRAGGRARASVLAGLGTVALAFVAMHFFAGRLIPFSASIALLGFGNGLVLPALNVMITSATGPQERGTVTSLYGTVRFFGAALGPPAFTRAVPLGTPGMFLGSATLAVLTGIAAAAYLDQRVLLTGRRARSAGGGVQPREPGRHEAPEGTEPPERTGSAAAGGVARGKQRLR